jgi:hypothetical protein
MSCKINIRALTDTLIGDKDWLRNTDYRTVFISESPKHRINDNNLLGAAKTYANEWNEAIRKVMPELSSGIYYAGLYMDSSKYMVMPGIQIRIPDHVQKELDIAGERIMKERIEAAKEKDRKDARKIQEEDAKRAGVEYTKEYLANRSRIEVADFVKLPEIRDVRTEWFNGKTSMSIKEFLTTVKENHPAYDKLVTYLLKNLSNDTEIQLVDFIAGKDGVITHGLYNPNDNKIKLSETSMNRKQSAIGTALHEILHAQTYHTLQNNPELRTKINDKIAYIKTQLNIGEDYYGLTNADEFVASLFTNSRFAKRLQEIPATDKTSISLFDQILQMFFEFLGFVKGTSVYLEAAKLVTEVIEKQYQETLEFENALEAQGYEATDMFDRTNDNIKEGVSELFESNPELANIGTQEQYSKYLDTIFPDSKIKNIVYHVTSKLAKENIITDGFNEPDEENLDITEDSLLWFSKNKNYYIDDKKILDLGVVQAILNIKYPTISDHQMFLDYGDLSGIRSHELRGDGLITKETPDIGKIQEDVDAFEEFIQTGKFPDGYVPNNESDLVFAAVPNKSQIHILGSKADIQGFKEFVNQNATNNLQSDISNLNLTEEVLNYFYENSSKSKDFTNFVMDLKRYVNLLQNVKTNEEIVELIKCL